MEQWGRTSLRVDARRIIFLAGDPAARWATVKSGVVAECEISPQGDRLLTGFRLPGENFGVDLSFYTRTAEASVPSLIECFPRPEPQTDSTFLATISAQLDRVRGDQRTVMLRSVSERLAAFLIDLADRGLGDQFKLPMPRCDIADFLGTTEPTISRTLSWLEDRGAIKRGANAELSLTNKPALYRYARRPDRDCC